MMMPSVISVAIAVVGGYSAAAAGEANVAVEANVTNGTNAIYKASAVQQYQVALSNLVADGAICNLSCNEIVMHMKIIKFPKLLALIQIYTNFPSSQYTLSIQMHFMIDFSIAKLNLRRI